MSINVRCWIFFGFINFGCFTGSNAINSKMINNDIVMDSLSFDLYGELKQCNLYFERNTTSIDKIIYILDGQIFEKEKLLAHMQFIDHSSNLLVVTVNSSEGRLKSEEDKRHCEFLASEESDYSKECKGVYQDHLDFFQNTLRNSLDSMFPINDSILETTIFGFSNSAGFAATYSLKYPQDVKQVFLFSPAGYVIPSDLVVELPKFNVFYGASEPLPFILTAKELHSELIKKSLDSTLYELEGGHSRSIWIEEVMKILSN